MAQKSKSEIFREIVTKEPVCMSEECPLRTHCLRSILKDYVPENSLLVTVVNLRNPKMQQEGCPRYVSDTPVRMPLGLRSMYFDMPSRLERLVKGRLIATFSRRRYYEYHMGRRPITPDIEQTIRQNLSNSGWHQEPAFDSYVEEYLLGY